MSNISKIQSGKPGPTKVSSAIVASNEEAELEEPVVINEPLSSKLWMIAKCLLSAIALPCYGLYFKQMFDEKTNMRVWEDLYGRSVFFFLASVAAYLYYSTKNQGISFFELEAKIRWIFALRLLSCGTSYGCLALALSQGRSIATPILTILGSQSVFRLYVNYSSESQQQHLASKIVSFLLLVLAMAGVGCLYSSDANPNPKEGLESQTKGLEFYNEKTAFFYALAASVLYSIGQLSMHRTKAFIHHSIDTIYVSLSMTLVTPSFVLSDYSMYPTKFSVSSNELAYYAAAGLLTWVFHSQMTQVICQPKETVSNPELCINVFVIAFFIACVFDQQVYGLEITLMQVAGAALLIVPAALYDVYCFFKRYVKSFKSS